MLKYLRMGSKRTKMIWWILVVVTVFTFIGGFIFLFGAGIDSGYQAKASGALGTVNGEPITQAEYQNAMAEQKEAFKQRFQTEPGEQEMRMVESQAWRSLVSQKLLDQKAKQLGLKASDKEVVLTLQAAPPQVLATMPDFQTNGQFDPSKYAAALRNPSLNWAPFEQMVRAQLPVRKLQERVIASIKLSQPELLEAYRQRFERVTVTVAQIPPALEAQVAAPTEADLTKTYEKYKGRFSGPERVRLELLSVPKKYSEEEVRVVREQAQSLVSRARSGEDFAQLAKDYSEGPGADKGGEVNRVFQVSEFAPELQVKLMATPIGGLTDPISENGRFVIVKVLDRVADPSAPAPGLKLAQIILNVHPSETTLREQFEDQKKLRDRARRIGLAKAATEKGLTTSRTGFFTYMGPPPQLYDTPNMVDWAFNAKAGSLSPLIESADAFLLAQVTDHRDAGPAPREDVVEPLRQLAEAEARLRASKPKADQIAQAVAQGKTLEQAAAAVGVTAFKTSPMSRTQPDPRVGGAPEVVGAAFGAPVGKLIGPIETPGGWFLLRVDDHLQADTAAFDQIKGQVTSEVLSRKQQEFMQSWVMAQRQGAKIQDLRSR